MQDYPDWLYQGYLFSAILRGTAPPGFHLAAYPVPNAVSTIIIGVGSFIFSPEVSGKIFLSLYILLFAGGSWYLLSTFIRKGESSLVVFPLLFMFNHPFFHGNVNYIFSLGILFFCSGYLLRVHEKSREPNTRIIAAVSLLLFFSHGSAYIAWVVFVIVFLCVGTKKFLKPLLALTPSLFLFLWYLVHGCIVTGSVESPTLDLSPVSLLKTKLFNAYIYCSPLPGFYPFTSNDASVLTTISPVNPLLCLVIAGIGIYWLRAAWTSTRTEKIVHITAAVYLLMFFFSPQRVAGMVRPGQRFLYPALWLIFTCAAAHIRFRRTTALQHVVMAAFVVVFTLVMLCIFISTADISREMNIMYKALKPVALEGEVAVIDESHFNYGGQFERPNPVPRILPSHAPLARLPYYGAIKKNQPLDIFQTGIIESGRDYPDLNSIKAIRSAVDFPDTILIIGDTAGKRYIASLLPNTFTTVLDHRSITVIKKKESS